MTGLSTLLNLPLVLHSVVPCVVAFPISFLPLPFSVQFFGGFPLSRNRYVRTRVNIIEAMYERSRVSVKLNVARLLRLRAILYTLPLFYSRT